MGRKVGRETGAACEFCELGRGQMVVLGPGVVCAVAVSSEDATACACPWGKKSLVCTLRDRLLSEAVPSGWWG